MFRNFYLIISLASLFFGSCNIINPAEITPTYVRIDSFSFSKDSLLNVTSTYDISSVWVYYNNNPIGVFDLPAQFPVRATENGVLTVRPAISVSGLNSFQATYPFYKSATLDITPQPGKVINFVPVTGFTPDTRFKTISNFEIGASNFSLASGSVRLSLTGNDSDKFEGNSSGRILLNMPTDTLSENYSTLTFSVPVNKDAYLELNYKNTVPFYLGMESNYQGTSYKTYLAGVSPSGGKWKKFYLALRDFIGQFTGDTYTVYIKASLEDGVQSGKVVLDNIQIVYFDK